MTREICFAIVLLASTVVMKVDAQEVAPNADVPAPPSTYATAPEVNEATTVTPAPAGLAALPPAQPVPNARRRFNISLGLGIGDAAGCGNEDPNSPCAIDGAATFLLGSDWRFHPNFGVGLEIGYWSFAVSDSWRGMLSGDPDADKTSIDASYIAVFGRWYWFDRGIVDPYIHLGFGGGSIAATIANSTESYRYTSSGSNTQLGAGVEFHVHPLVRLGPQLLASLLLSNDVCEKAPGMGEMCRKPMKNEMDEREGNALAWRFMLVGSVMLGER